MISKKYKCIFVHIPRTGGTSIEKLIWPSRKDKTESNLRRGFIDKHNNRYQTGGLQHLLANQVKQEVGSDIFNNYFSFTFVRNPWDKIISQFEYIKTRKDLLDFIGMSDGNSFKKYLSLIQKKEHVQWTPQYRFILDDNGEYLLDFIGQFEFFENDLNKIKLMLGLRTKKIPHVNKSTRSIYNSYYDDESKELVRQLYKIDIELFGYHF